MKNIILGCLLAINAFASDWTFDLTTANQAVPSLWTDGNFLMKFGDQSTADQFEVLLGVNAGNYYVGIYDVLGEADVSPPAIGTVKPDQIIFSLPDGMALTSGNSIVDGEPLVGAGGWNFAAGSYQVDGTGGVSGVPEPTVESFFFTGINHGWAAVAALAVIIAVFFIVSRMVRRAY